MTKKEFKEMCSFHTYRGHRTKINAIFFDWKTDKATGHSFGYKYMVSSNVENLSKAELFDYFYQWVTEKIVTLPWYINYRYADTDRNRFKVPLSL